MKRILVPCDFCEQSTNAFRFAIHLGKTLKAEIYLLYVVELPFLHDTLLMPSLSYEEEKFKDLRRNGESRLDHIRRKHSTPKVKLKSKVEFGSPSKKIIGYISSK